MGWPGYNRGILPLFVEENPNEKFWAGGQALTIPQCCLRRFVSSNPHFPSTLGAGFQNLG